MPAVRGIPNAESLKKFQLGMSPNRRIVVHYFAIRHSDRVIAFCLYVDLLRGHVMSRSLIFPAVPH